MRRPIPLPPGYVLREFQAADAEAFPGHREYLASLGYHPDAYLRALEDGACFTVLKDGKIVASGGVLLSDHGQDTAWYLPTPDVQEHPKLHFALAREFFAIMDQAYGFPAIWATADAHDRRAQNWLEHLGFQRGQQTTVYGAPHISYTRERPCLT